MHSDLWHGVTHESIASDPLRWPTGPVIGPFQAFYHIAVIGNWKEVVTEQASLFRDVGLSPKCVVLGSATEAEWVVSQGLTVVETIQDLDRFETPTIAQVKNWADKNPQGAVLYCHTKGVSESDDQTRKVWRHLMNEWVIRDWRAIVDQLCWNDAIGFGLASHKNTQIHFAGNFWIARSSWINQLPEPYWFRTLPMNDWTPSHKWDRIHAECWIGAGLGRFASVGATNVAYNEICKILFPIRSN